MNDEQAILKFWKQFDELKPSEQLKIYADMILDGLKNQDWELVEFLPVALSITSNRVKALEGDLI